MLGGYSGRLLRVDLTRASSAIELLSEDFFRSYLGGNGIAAYLLLHELTAGVDPFSEENCLVLATGPWNDTPIPGSSRSCIATKSPLTGIFYDSTFGGRFPVTLKRTGFDAVVFSGKAECASYVLIDENGISLCPAEDLVGLGVREAVEAVRAIEGRATDILAIGPAGENMVRFACAGHYWENREGFAGRGGIGAVMGAKNLKAIAVRGKHRNTIARNEELHTFLQTHRAEVRRGTEGLTEYGTPMLAKLLNAMGAMGTRNLDRETWDQVEQISGETLKEKYWKQNTTCFVCPVACGKDVEITSGPLKGTYAKAPEWETVYAFGPLLENANIESIIKAGELCDELGLDTITMGVTLAFLYECFEKGIVTESDVGFTLRFGDAEPILKLIRMTAFREGIGNLLAEGSAAMAAQLGQGAENSLLTVKGLEIPGHSPRALKGMSLGYATATRGGSHHDARPTPFYVGAADRFSVADAPAFAVRSQNFTAVGDSLVQCRFVGERGGYGLFLDDTYAHLVNLVTGWDCSVAELERIGERIYALERCFNVRENVRRPLDRLPFKVMHIPIPEGPSQGLYCAEDELNAMLDEYYRLRGWDVEGVPTRAKLDEIGIGEAADFVGIP